MLNMKVVFFIVLQVGGLFGIRDEHHKRYLAKDSMVNELERSSDFWNKKAQNFLSSKLKEKLNTNKAKNVIFFLGDGMSLSTVAATRMYMGGEQVQLSFEQFPNYGLSKTYCIDRQVADSACTATAYLNAVKANYRTIGINGKVLESECKIDDDELTESIVSWAQKSCKATGIVTTTRITHASPAGAYAHTTNRDWESNNEISEKCKADGDSNVRDIAYQLVHNEVSKNLKVILGGGRAYFINNTELDDERRPGLRTDGRNLIDEWMAERSKNGNAKFVWHNQQLKDVEVHNTDYLLGLFEADHCLYNLDIVNNNLQYQEPSLTDMTVKAIKMLQKDENGFFLFVEGGRIDHAHHKNLAHKALEETKEFSKAIEAARQMTSEADTLIVVTSDHSHVFTYNGDSLRGNDILGFPGVNAADKKPFFSLSYANGPGHEASLKKVRVNLTGTDFHNPELKHSSTVQLKDDTHAGEDVGIYTSGPWSHLFQGTFEQNNIPMLMAFASKIGPFSEPGQKCSAGSIKMSFVLIAVSLIITFTTLTIF